MTRTERVELIFEQRTHRFLRSVRIFSAVWQARAAPGVAPVGRRSLAHLALSPRRALLALQPHALGALGRLAPLVGLPALAAPGAIGRPPREGPCDAGATCGPRRLRHLSGDAAGEGPEHVPGPAAVPDGRLGGPAIRPWTHRFGTLDVEWQCEGVLPVRSPPRGSERCAENPLNVSVTFKAGCWRPRSHSSAVLGRDRSSGCPDSRRRP